MIESLLKNGIVDRVLAATAAGTDDTLTGDILDLQNSDGALGVAILGDVAATSVVSLKAFTGNEPALGDGTYEAVYATVTATAANADNKLLILDIIKPGKRYCRFDLVRATANAVVDGVIAIRYNNRVVPVTQGADVVDAEINVG